MTDDSEDTTGTDHGEKDEGDEPAVLDANLPEGDDPGHSLPDADLHYPTIEFENGEVASNGALALSKETNRDEMGSVATALAGALASHDLGIATPDGFTTFGIAPQGVEMSFEPDENHRGDLEITFRLSAKTMFVADDDDAKVGSRGGKGFVPLSMLTEDRDLYRCYSWIDDPENPH